MGWVVYICVVLCVLVPFLWRQRTIIPMGTLDFFVFFQAEDGIRDAQESRGLGDVYKRQATPSGSSPLSN